MYVRCLLTVWVHRGGAGHAHAKTMTRRGGPAPSLYILNQ